jgi:hypothetical protein
MFKNLKIMSFVINQKIKIPKSLFQAVITTLKSENLYPRNKMSLNHLTSFHFHLFLYYFIFHFLSYDDSQNLQPKVK